MVADPIGSRYIVCCKSNNNSSKRPRLQPSLAIAKHHHHPHRLSICLGTATIHRACTRGQPQKRSSCCSASRITTITIANDRQHHRPLVRPIVIIRIAPLKWAIAVNHYFGNRKRTNKLVASYHHHHSTKSYSYHYRSPVWCHRPDFCHRHIWCSRDIIQHCMHNIKDCSSQPLIQLHCSTPPKAWPITTADSYLIIIVVSVI